MSLPVIFRSIAVSALLLGAFALVGAGLVAFTDGETRERIRENRRVELLHNLQALIEPARYDNALESDIIQVQDAALLGTQNWVTVYRARKNGAPVAALIAPVAPNGYSGEIHLLVGVNFDGTLSGVRVSRHRETPGLGDAIDTVRSDWVHEFAGHSLENPSQSGWRVKKDGGEFDQFTGATITPRAVVAAVHRTLLFFRANRDRLFEMPAQAVEAGG